MEKSRITENEADESDSSSDDSNYYKPLRRRSATVSPAAGTRFRHHSKSRRRSEMSLTAHKQAPSLRRPDGSCMFINLFFLNSSDVSPRYEHKDSLRKTNSMPSFEEAQKAHVEAIRHLLDLFPISPCNQSSSAHEVWQSHRQNVVPKMVESESEDDIINTDIEELRDAAQSIQSLQRVLKVPPESTNINDEMVDRRTNCPVEGDSSSESLRQSGIASRLGGHPRGVIQFLPSAKQTEFFPTLDTYNTYNKNKKMDKKSLLRRKTSLPEIYDQVYNSSDIIRPKAVNNAYKSGRWSFRSDIPNLQYSSKNAELMEQKPTIDSIAGGSRFSKLLKSLRSSRQNSPEPQSSNSWNPMIYTSTSSSSSNPLMQADLLLWNKRSRTSIRRHNDVRNMAIRELCDTEKTFVENLEYLTQKYMRPLRQPLECTLIDPILADKIFYKVPEILIHHQHFLAALCDRLDTFQTDARIGDVLLSHFRKQSMVDTYIAFVDNFKFSKQSIKQARERPAFEKYYMRCRRDHRNKLDLDSLLISPIQRVPRYELILKQIIKHTSVEHADYDSLLVAQTYIHELATKINRQKEESEEMEQRLREIEAIVDGLDDLVTTGRSFNRYDVVTVLGVNQNKQRCLFLMSDQIIVTNVRGKSSTSFHSSDFLDNNRFKLLFKISLDDVVIAKDTLSLLHAAEIELQNVQEDINIVKKMTELSKLLKKPNIELTNMLDNLEIEMMRRKRLLQEQLTSDPLLTIVQLQITTTNGVGVLVIQFPNADRRAIWEHALIKAKTALKNELQNEERPNHLKSFITHRTRPGLTFSAAAATLGKSVEEAPNVWVCTSDKFSGQVAVINVNDEPTIESTTSIGNAAIVAICSVPAPRKKRKLPKLVDSPSRDLPGLELDSTSSESGDSDLETVRRNVQSTVWIGNEDGEIFVFNFLDNVRLKACEMMARLSMPIDDIVYLEEKVFVSISSGSNIQLLHFERNKEGKWDLDNPKSVQIDFRRRMKPMVVAASRLCFASGNSIYLLNTSSLQIEKQATVSASAMETVSCLAVLGSTIFVAMNKSSIVKVINAFTLDCQQEFSVSHVVNKALSSSEDIIRKHKMGCLRITSLLCCNNRLWIGTSAGIVINTLIPNNKTSNWAPSLNVCQAGHIGPCRFLTAVSATATSSFNSRRRRMSLSAPILQQIEQLLHFYLHFFLITILVFPMFVVSGGEGFDSGTAQVDGEKRKIDDAVNYLLFWSA
uniref:DH domain-containing protein n=1 Tax=Onchocerca volvulus TaxID=6282 RepID=A0A8R1U228_ONCVO